jgi:hypothetical protein
MGGMSVVTHVPDDVAEPQLSLTLGPCSPLTNYSPAWGVCAMMLIFAVMCGGYAVMATQPSRPLVVLSIGAAAMAVLFLGVAIYGTIGIIDESRQTLIVTVTPRELRVRRRGGWRKTREFQWRRDEVFEVRVGTGAHGNIPALQVRLYDAPPEPFFAGRQKKNLEAFAASIADALRRIPPQMPVDARIADEAIPTDPAAPPLVPLDYANRGERYEIDIRPLEDGGVTIVIPQIAHRSLLGTFPPIVVIMIVVFVIHAITVAFGSDPATMRNILGFGGVVIALLIARLAIIARRAGEPFSITLDRRRLVVINPAWLRQRRTWPQDHVQSVKIEPVGTRKPELVARLYVDNWWITLGAGRDDVELRRIADALNRVLLSNPKREQKPKLPEIRRRELTMSTTVPQLDSAQVTTIVVPPSRPALKRGLIVGVVGGLMTLVCCLMIFTTARMLIAGTGPRVAIIPLVMMSIVFPAMLVSLASQGLFRPLLTGLLPTRFDVTPTHLEVRRGNRRRPRFSWPRASIRDVIVHLAYQEKSTGIFELRIIRAGEPRPVSLLYAASEPELAQIASQLREALRLESREASAAHYLEQVSNADAVPFPTEPSNSGGPPVLPYAPQPEQFIVERAPGRLRVLLPAPAMWPTIRGPFFFLMPLVLVILIVSVVLPLAHGRSISPSAFLIFAFAAALTIGWAVQRFRDTSIDVDAAAGLTLTRRGRFGIDVQTWDLEEIQEIVVEPNTPQTVKLCVAGGQIVNLATLATPAEARALAAILHPALGFSQPPPAS